MITGIRNWFFEIGILPITRIGVPVISVGNISSGGTGKTPLAEAIVRKLQAKGWNPAILSRGYGRRSRGYVLVSNSEGRNAGIAESGDEPMELAEKLKGAVIAVDEDRVEGARRVVQEQDVDCVVLDDGFQHRYLARDVNIVLLTAEEIVRQQYLLPAGNRRETMASLKRADLIVISKCRDAEEFGDAAGRLAGSQRGKVAGFRLKSKAMQNASDGTCLDQKTAVNTPVLVFSGIGDPDSFEQSVSEVGCRVVGRFDFADHHWYVSEDLRRLREEFRSCKAKFLVTTRKDLVRLEALGGEWRAFLKEVTVTVLETEPEFIAGEEVLDDLIQGLAR